MFLIVFFSDYEWILEDSGDSVQFLLRNVERKRCF